MLQFTVKVPTLAPEARGHAVAGALTWVAGVVALYTFFLNREQKDRLHDQQLKQVQHLDELRRNQENEFEIQRRQQAEDFEQRRQAQAARFERDRRELEVSIEDRRERRERDLAELQRMEAEFAALINALERVSPIARINAAIGLAELAMKPDPRRIRPDGELMEERRFPLESNTMPVPTGDKRTERRSEWIELESEYCSRKSEENFPLFMRAVNRLAAALLLWQSDNDCREGVSALRRLAQFAKDKGTDEPLLHEMVNALADANRRSWHLLRVWAGHCKVAGTSEAELLKILGLPNTSALAAGMASDRQAAEALLEHLLAGVQEIPEVFSAKVGPNGKSMTRSEKEAMFYHAGTAWFAVSEALDCAISELSAPPDLIDPPGLYDVNPIPVEHNVAAVRFKAQQRNFMNCVTRWQRSAERLKVRRKLDLRHIVLHGRYWGDVHLECADLTRASFFGCQFNYVHLEGVRLNAAKLVRCGCIYSTFVGVMAVSVGVNETEVGGCDFSFADLRMSWIQDSHLNQVLFHGANLSGAKLTGVTLNVSDFAAANLSGARMVAVKLDDVRLAGASMGQREGTATEFEGCEWQRADFAFYDFDKHASQIIASNERDEELIEFLEKKYQI